MSGSGCGRQFMMTEAAFGRVEAKHMERLADLWNSPEQWNTISPQCLTAQFRALCLRVLARQGAAVEQLLAHPHRQFPFALFQLQETPEEASNMVTIPECRKDTWTLAMQKQYPDLRGDDLLCLSLRQASVLQTFRTCLRAEIRQRLVIKRGAPPINAVNYKKQILDLFLTHTAKQGTVYFIGPSAEALTDPSSISRMLETGLHHANVQLEAQLVA